MTELIIEKLIQKVIWLEKIVGSKTSYRLLEPFIVNTKDIISIQNAAKKIAEFIGLNNFTFIVSVNKQEEKVAGKIELEWREREVFIDISEKIVNFPDAVLATLSHEIAHKYLQVNQIKETIEFENEILTDVTTIFLGLGKLMLNGCEYSIQTSGHDNNVVQEKFQLGYLKPNQIAFVYLLVCAMRKIPRNEYEQGLSSSSLKVLRICEKNYIYYFKDSFHNPEIKNEVLKKFNSEIREAQIILSEIDNYLNYIQQSSIDVTTKFLNKAHKRFMSLLNQAQNICQDGEVDPCLRFLNSLIFEQTIIKWVAEIKNYSLEAYKYQKSIRKLANNIQILGHPFPKPNIDMFIIIKCYNDGTKIRLPYSEKTLVAKCPQCDYHFIAKTSVPKFEEPNQPIEKRTSGIKNIFKSLFKIK